MPINRRRLLTMFGLGAVLGPAAIVSAPKSAEITEMLGQGGFVLDAEMLDGNYYDLLTYINSEDVRAVTVDYTVAWDQDGNITETTY